MTVGDSKAELFAALTDDLRESEEKYRLLVENSPVCIHQIDRQGRLMSMNRAGLAMMGVVDESDIVGLVYLDVVADCDRARIAELMEAAIDGESSGFEFETRNGRYFRSSFVPIRDESGSVARLMGLTMDVTKRRQAEDRARDYQSRLRSLNAELSVAEERERRRIASDLHDRIGQTLAVARMKAAEALRRPDDPNTSKLRELTHLLDEAVQHTRFLTHEISPPVLYDLGFEAAVQWLAHEFDERYEVKVSFRDDGQSKPLPEPIRIFLFKSVRELLLNALKHSEAGELDVALTRESDQLVVTVSDDGKGFDVESQLDARVNGGFGLFNVRDRLDYYGGACEIRSAAGAGTSVVMRVPIDG